MESAANSLRLGLKIHREKSLFVEDKEVVQEVEVEVKNEQLGGDEDENC